MEEITLDLNINGENLSLTVKSGKRLLDILREDLNMKGTKEGCGIGECGACSVILNGEIVNSCLVMAGQLAHETANIVTIEGLGNNENGLHPLQRSFIDKGAVQCGFCTPGMIISAKALLDDNPSPSKSEIKEAISGNLCRCTGYEQIIEAIQKAAREM